MAKKLYQTEAPQEEAQTTESFSTKSDKEVEASVEVVSGENNISNFMKVILKAYPDCDYLFIDSRGGVFGKDAKLSQRGNAILYKNPYYQK